MAIDIKPSHRGLFAKDVGKKPGTSITGSDIARGKASSDPAERKRATFAANAREWHHGGGKSKSRASGRASRMYGAKS
jgi:hypothetical protein